MYLGGGSCECFSLLDVVMGAVFPLDILGGLLAAGPDLVLAEVVVDDILHLQLNGGRVYGEGPSPLKCSMIVSIAQWPARIRTLGFICWWCYTPTL